MSDEQKSAGHDSLRTELKLFHALLTQREDMQACTYPVAIARDALAEQELLYAGARHALPRARVAED